MATRHEPDAGTVWRIAGATLIGALGAIPLYAVVNDLFEGKGVPVEDLIPALVGLVVVVVAVRVLVGTLRET